jgi:hypothetical protein
MKLINKILANNISKSDPNFYYHDHPCNNDPEIEPHAIVKCKECCRYYKTYKEILVCKISLYNRYLTYCKNCGCENVVNEMEFINF